MMNNIIFLDFDDVLHVWKTRAKDKYGILFDAKMLKRLAKIVESGNAKIVVSSSWKSCGLSMLQEMWKFRGYPGEIIDVIPDTLVVIDGYDEGEHRGIAIQYWLENYKVDNYIIIDDNVSQMLFIQHNHVVHVKRLVGLTDHDVDIACMILNCESIYKITNNTL